MGEGHRLREILCYNLKFLVKVFFKSISLEVVDDTLHVGRYWSEVLCCTIMTHPGDLEDKVMDIDFG